MPKTLGISDGGNLASRTDPNGNVTRFDYDKLNRRTAITDALGNVTRFVYDAVGNRKELVKANGESQLFSYDADMRLARIAAGDETWDFSYNADDLLTRLSNGAFATSYGYDTGHRMTSLNYETFGKALGFSYDASGDRTRLVREDGTNVDYVYDALHRLVEITEHNRKYRFAYDPAGRTTGRIYPNGVASSYEHDPAGRLKSLKHHKSGGALLAGFEYAYDANGNRISMRDNLGLHEYDYDKLDRLTSATFPSGRMKQYAYDGVGNRTKLTETIPVPLAKLRGIDTQGQPPSGSIEQVANYTYDAADRILTAGERAFVHDAVGRLAEARAPPSEVKAFQYDGFDRPIKIAGLKDSLTNNPLPDSLYEYAPLTPTLDFGLAPLGARIQKTDSQGVTKYLVDNTANVLAELGPDNAVKRRFVHALNIDDPLAITDEFGDTFFMLPDGLGSVSMLVDREGDPVQLYNYEPFGEPNVEAKDKNSLKFTAREFDHDAALQYSRARYLDLIQGRWITPDPSALLETEYYIGRLNNPRRLSRCIYAENNPLSLSDPEGLQASGSLPLPGIITKPVPPLPRIGARAKTGCETLKEGSIVYRVFGGNSLPFGRSWTDLDPFIGDQFVLFPGVGTRSVYRSRAGLPPWNSGTRYFEGVVKRDTPVQRLIAPPFPSELSWQEGGWPEIRIAESALAVRVMRSLIVNPPF